MNAGIGRRWTGERSALIITTALAMMAVLSLSVAHACLSRPALAGSLAQSSGEQLTVRMLDGGQVSVTVDFGAVAANWPYVVLRDTEAEGGYFAGEPLKVGPQAQTIYEGVLDEKGRDQFTFDMSAEISEFGDIYDYFFQAIAIGPQYPDTGPLFSNRAELAPWIIEEGSHTPTHTPTATPTRSPADLGIDKGGPEPGFPWWLPVLCLLPPLLFSWIWIWKWLRNWLRGRGGPAQVPKPQAPPTIVFTSPQPDQVVLPSNFPITLAYQPGASPLGPTPKLTVEGPQGQVHMKVNALRATGDWSRNPPFASGKTTLVARITDQAGETATARVTFYVDGKAPELALHLNWAKSKIQWTKGIGNKATRSPSRPVFPHRNLQLSIWIRERPDPPGYAGLDYENKKVKLIADFPCRGLKAGDNLLSVGGPRSRKLFQELLIFDEPLPDGDHTLTLSAADRLGNANTIHLVFTTRDDTRLMVADESGNELEAIPLVWREWADYSPFYFYIVVEDPSVHDTEKELRATLASKKDVRLYQHNANVVLKRDESGAPRFRSRPFLAWAEDELRDNKTDLRRALERWTQNQTDPDRAPILIHGAPQGEIKVSAEGREQTLPVPDRRAMILAPALGCPGLAHSGDEIEVILMMRNELESPTNADVAGALGWCEWPDRDTGNVRPVCLSDVSEVKTWKKAGILQTFHLSPTVEQSYEGRGYGRRVYAHVRVPRKECMHALLALHEERTVLHHALNRQPRPQFPYPSSPLCPILPVDTETLGLVHTGDWSFETRKVPVAAYHPVAVFSSTKQFLNIAHLSDTHIAARWDLLDQRWSIEQRREEERSEIPTITSKNIPFFPVPKMRGQFNNPNAQTRRMLDSVGGKDSEADVIIISGDLIDYNRGLLLTDPQARERNDLSRDYYLNVNWLYFYEMLLDTYGKPVFTLLGNHDWRLNPYPPLPTVLGIYEVCAYAKEVNLTRAEMEILHKNAREVSVLDSLPNKPTSPLYTCPEAVHWYSFVINPFYDYTARFGRVAFAMLDWVNGEEGDLFSGLPRPMDTISPDQWGLLEKWAAENEEGIIAIVCLHAPIINPKDEVGDTQVSAIEGKDLSDHSLMSHLHQWPPAPRSKELSHGTIVQDKAEFIVWATGTRGYLPGISSGVPPGAKLVLSGHTHRGGLYEVNETRVQVRLPYEDYLKELRQNQDRTVFAVVGSSGLLGLRNEKGGKHNCRLVEPVYRLITFDEEGNITSCAEKTVDPVTIREEVRRDHGEATGED